MPGSGTRGLRLSRRAEKAHSGNTTSASMKLSMISQPSPVPMRRAAASTSRSCPAKYAAEPEIAATPRVARFQTSASSSSATEMLKPWRSLSLRRAHRLPPVLQRLRMLDGEFQRQGCDRHPYTSAISLAGLARMGAIPCRYKETHVWKRRAGSFWPRDPWA